MVHKACGGGEAAVAGGASDGFTQVGGRVEVLPDIIAVHELAVAVVAVVVILNLVHIAPPEDLERVGAEGALIVKVVLVVLVLPLGARRVEASPAPVAVV